MPTQGGIHGSLLHAVPIPLPVFRTPPLWPMDADPWGSRSSRNGHSQPQWRPPTAHLESPPPHLPGAEPRPAPPGFTPPLPHSQRVSSCSGASPPCPPSTPPGAWGKGLQGLRNTGTQDLLSRAHPGGLGMWSWWERGWGEGPGTVKAVGQLGLPSPPQAVHSHCPLPSWKIPDHRRRPGLCTQSSRCPQTSYRPARTPAPPSAPCPASPCLRLINA